MRRMAGGNREREPVRYMVPERNVRSGRRDYDGNNEYGYDQPRRAYGREREREREYVAGAGDLNSDDDRFVDDIRTASKLSPTDPGGFRGLFINECARLIEQREYEFKRYTEYAEDLEKAIEYKMEWTKDRQDNAIYAFTLVTIVFLPLSAVSGVFGMNTADIRNLEQGQWLYWAVAIPVTLLVIILGLWWMNELDNITGWMFGKATRGRSTPRYSNTAPPPRQSPEPKVVVYDYNNDYDDRREAAEPVQVRMSSARPVSRMRMEYPVSQQARMRRPARPVYR